MDNKEIILNSANENNFEHIPMVACKLHVALDWNCEKLGMKTAVYEINAYVTESIMTQMLNCAIDSCEIVKIFSECRPFRKKNSRKLFLMVYCWLIIIMAAAYNQNANDWKIVVTVENIS